MSETWPCLRAHTADAYGDQRASAVRVLIDQPSDTSCGRLAWPPVVLIGPGASPGGDRAGLRPSRSRHRPGGRAGNPPAVVSP